MIDLTSIPRLARSLGRLIEIARTLAKYGLADALARLDYRFVKRWTRETELARLSTESRDARIRLALTELGPTFIKFGQVLSTRRDLVGAVPRGRVDPAPVRSPGGFPGHHCVRPSKRNWAGPSANSSRRLSPHHRRPRRSPRSILRRCPMAGGSR